ncbi:Signal transduction histidine kinase [Chryseobacterium soldanellicola]|uniref:histidine kinase n=2 Tax=Chryseobacterium soldanellicola TaxID=311333 RepID=A0A1H1DSJ6_9FLAO|nr:Signal transduction histidine kinase [Chryseobacterium soldanellicola]
MKYFYLIILFIFSGAQGQNYTSKSYSMDNGLPQNSIKDIFKDKYGFIWLSTEGGILRYDGTKFIQYRNFKFKNLSFSDFNGNKKKDSVIICNDLERDAALISKRVPKATSVNTPYKTEWSVDNKRYKRFIKNNIIVRFGSYIHCYFIELQDGIYYFENNSVTYLDKKSKKRTLLPLDFPHYRLKKVFVHDDHIFISDGKNRKLLQIYKGNLSSINAASIYNDPETKIYWQQLTNQVFMINHGNIYRSYFSKGKLSLTFLAEYKNIDKDLAGAMFYDDDSGKLFIGSPINGLKIVSSSKFYVSTKNLPYEDEVKYGSIPFGDSSVITSEGIRYYKNKAEKVFYTRESYDRRYIFSDDSGNLIYRENNSIHRRYKKDQFKKHDSVFFENKKIDALLKAGNMYLASVSDTKLWYLYIFDHDNFKKINTIIPFKESINAALQYDKDQIYLGSSNGLYVFSVSKNKLIKKIGKDIPVKHILRTKDGNIWFTTFNRGFYLLKNNEIIKMPGDKNDYISSAHYILEDKNSDFWISSNNGLFRVNKKSLLNYAQTGKGLVTYYRYTTENGFLNNEFNGTGTFPCANNLNDGEFVFSSMQGFVFFKPHEIRKYYPNPRNIFIERVKIDGKKIHFKDKLFLEKEYKIADVYIDIPYFSNLENIYLQAKLENSEYNQWVDIKNDKQFRLTNLKPGEYKLTVRFLSDGGKFIYKSLPIEIEAYFYQTALFKIFIFLLSITVLLAIILGITKLLWIKNKALKNTLHTKNKQLRESNTNLEITKNQLKNESDYQKKLIESISHDITTPVRFIALLSQELHESDDAKTQKKYFDSIYKTSEQLYKFTLGLKEYTELYKEENTTKEVFKLYDLIEEKKMLFDEIAKHKNTFLYNFCDHDVSININRNILLVIFHNIIDNAVKNTSDGKIIITTAIKNAQVEICIQDSGSGMSHEQMEYYSNLFKPANYKSPVFKNYGLGLHMVIQLITKINAEISFQKNIPQGTIVKIIMDMQ